MTNLQNNRVGPVHSNKKLHLNAIEQRVILEILHRYVSGFDVCVFGSRAGGQPEKFSDLDLAIMTEEPLSFAQMADLQDAFDESDLSFKVDLVDWATTNENFRNIIKNNGLLFKEGLASVVSGEQ